MYCLFLNTPPSFKSQNKNDMSPSDRKTIKVPIKADNHQHYLFNVQRPSTITRRLNTCIARLPTPVGTKAHKSKLIKDVIIFSPWDTSCLHPTANLVTHVKIKGTGCASAHVVCAVSRSTPI